MNDGGATDVVHRGYESKDLDYKGVMVWDNNDKKSCCDLVKDILAMANVGGGFIVIGVEEPEPGSFVPKGLSRKQLATFETTKVNQFVQRYADPPINCRLVKPEGKFVVIEVPPFHETPHLCVKPYPGVLSEATIYIRTDNNESAPLGSSSDFRRLLAQAVRNSHEEFLQKLDALLKGRTLDERPAADELFDEEVEVAGKVFEQKNPYPEKGYESYLEFVFQPERHQKNRFDLEELRQAAMGAVEDFRGWPFLFIHVNRPECTHNVAGGIETLIDHSSFRDGDMLDFWRFLRSGLFYQRKLVWEATHDFIRAPHGDVLDLKYNIGYLAEAARCLGRLYDGLLPPSETVRLRISFIGMQGRRLVELDNKISFMRGDFICHEDAFSVERTTSLAQWIADPIGCAVEMGSELCEMFNWGFPSEGLLQTICKDHLSRKMG